MSTGEIFPQFHGFVQNPEAWSKKVEPKPKRKKKTSTTVITAPVQEGDDNDDDDITIFDPLTGKFMSVYFFFLHK